MSGDFVKVGFTADGNKVYVIEKWDDSMAYVKESVLFGDPVEAFKRLATQNFYYPTPKLKNLLLERVQQATALSDKLFADRVGWHQEHFVLGDGTVISPAGSQPPVVVFPPERLSRSASGSAKAWKTGLGHQLSGQSILQFVTMQMFVAPLVPLLPELSSRKRPIFELVGARGTGKSLANRVAASVWGPVLGGTQGRYWCRFDELLLDPASATLNYQDHPMVIEEVGDLLAGLTSGRKVEAIKSLLYQLSDRSICLISGNERLRDLAGRASEELIGAESDRIITLEVPERLYHIFEALPDGYANSGEYADALQAAATADFGEPIRTFLRKLVDERARDEAALIAWLEEKMNLFRTKAAVDLNDGSQRRVADEFAAGYAAGSLARRFGVLPKAWNCANAVYQSYLKYRVVDESKRSFGARFSSLLRATNLTLGGEGEQPSEEEVDAADAVLYQGTKGMELLIRPCRIERIFPDWTALSKQRSVRKRLRKEKGHLTIKRKLLASQGQTRVYCFPVTDLDE